MRHMTTERLWGRSFTSLCVSIFSIFFSFYTLIPTLPVYVITKFSAGTTEVGLLMTAFALSALASRPIAAPLMKRFGEKRLFVSAALLGVVAISLYLVSDSFPLLLGLRVIHGLSLGIVTSTGATLASRLVPKARTGEGMGYYGMSESLALVIGPLVGLTLIQTLPFRVLFLACALFALVGFLSGLLVQVSAKAADEPSTTASPATGIRAFMEPAAIPVALCAALVAFAYGGLLAFGSVYGNELGLTRFTNYFFTVFALMMMMPRPWIGRLFDKLGAHFVIYPGIVIFTVGLFCLGQSQTGFGYLGSAALLGLGWGALTSLLALTVQSVPADRKGHASSTYFFFIDTGVSTGSLLLGMIAGRSGYHAMFLVSAVVVSLTAALYYLLHHRPTAQRQAHLARVVIIDRKG